jgi:hypothetical protein
MGLLAIFMFYAVSVAALYAVIYYAVRNALRDHDQDRHPSSQ